MLDGTAMPLHLAGVAVAVLAIVIAGSAHALDADALLDGSRVVPVEIVLPADDWEALRRETRGPAGIFASGPPKKFTWHRGRATIDGTTVVDAGIRKKGFFGSVDSARPSLIVDFNRFVPQDPVEGLGRLTLNNNKQDASCAAQFLAYRTFREAGVPAPRVGFAAVTVNGEPLGVYSNVESIKKPFLARSYGSDEGGLYEGTVADLVPDSLAKMEIETHDRLRPRLEELAGLLAAEGPLDLARVEAIVDVEEFLSFMAVEALIGMWDGYSSNQNNYFVHVPTGSGRITFIPWGADSAFSAVPVMLPALGRGPAPAIYAQGALANRLAFAPGMIDRYRRRLREILDTCWKEDELLAEVDRLGALLAPHLAEGQSAAAKSLDAVRDFIRRRRGEIEKSLDSWPPELPGTFRKPMTTKRVGSVSGTFATVQRAQADDEAPAGEIACALTLADGPVAYAPASVSAYPLPMPGPWSRPDTATDAPLGVTVSGTRADGKPLTLTFMLDRRLVRESTGGFAAGGILTEGTGFFGSGPMRIVGGTVSLGDRGLEPGSRLSGTFAFGIDETSGGFSNSAPKRRPGVEQDRSAPASP
jgi:spore coat protein CotH